MAGLVFGCARRLCLSPSAWFNRNGVLSRAFSTTDPTKQVQINLDPNQVGVGCLEALMKESENWELFKSWMCAVHKKYKNPQETLYRFKMFSEHLEKPEEDSILDYFVDMTEEEFSRWRGGLIPKRPAGCPPK